MLPLNKKTLKPYVIASARNCHKFAISTWHNHLGLAPSDSLSPSCALAAASGRKVSSNGKIVLSAGYSLVTPVFSRKSPQLKTYRYINDSVAGGGRWQDLCDYVLPDHVECMSVVRGAASTPGQIILGLANGEFSLLTLGSPEVRWCGVRALALATKNLIASRPCSAASCNRSRSCSLQLAARPKPSRGAACSCLKWPLPM